MEDLEVYEGEVIFFKKSYGFLSWEKKSVKQKDMFVYWVDIQSEGFKTFKKGQKVKFSLGKNNNGDPKAINVILL